MTDTELAALCARVRDDLLPLCSFDEIAERLSTGTPLHQVSFDQMRRTDNVPAAGAWYSRGEAVDTGWTGDLSFFVTDKSWTGEHFLRGLDLFEIGHVVHVKHERGGRQLCFRVKVRSEKFPGMWLAERLLRGITQDFGDAA